MWVQDTLKHTSVKNRQIKNQFRKIKSPAERLTQSRREIAIWQNLPIKIENLNLGETVHLLVSTNSLLSRLCKCLGIENMATKIDKVDTTKEEPWAYEPLSCLKCGRIFVNDPEANGTQCPCGIRWRHETQWKRLSDAEIRLFLQRKDQKKLKSKIGWRMFKLPMPAAEQPHEAKLEPRVVRMDASEDNSPEAGEEFEYADQPDCDGSSSDDSAVVEYYAGDQRDKKWKWNNYYNPKGAMQIVSTFVGDLIGLAHVKKFKFLVNVDVLNALEEEGNPGEFDWARKFMSKHNRPASFIFISPKRLLHAQTLLWGSEHWQTNQCSVLLPPQMVDKVKKIVKKQH